MPFQRLIIVQGTHSGCRRHQRRAAQLAAQLAASKRRAAQETEIRYEGGEPVLNVEELSHADYPDDLYVGTLKTSGLSLLQSCATELRNRQG